MLQKSSSKHNVKTQGKNAVDTRTYVYLNLPDSSGECAQPTPAWLLNTNKKSALSLLLLLYSFITVEEEAVEFFCERQQFRVVGFVFLALAVAVHGCAVGRSGQGCERREGRRRQRNSDGCARRGAHVH